MSRVLVVILMGVVLTSCMVKDKELSTELSEMKVAVTQELKGVFTPVASMYDFLDKLNMAADISDISDSGDSAEDVLKKNIFKFSEEAKMVFDYLTLVEFGDFTVEGENFELVYNVNLGEFEPNLELTPFKILAKGELVGEVVGDMKVFLVYELDGSTVEREIYLKMSEHKEVIFEELMVGVLEITHGEEVDVDAIGGIASSILADQVVNEYVFVNFVPEAFSLEVGLIDGKTYEHEIPDRPYKLLFNKFHVIFDESGINFEQSEIEIKFVNIETEDTVDLLTDGVYVDGDQLVSWKELIK